MIKYKNKIAYKIFWEEGMDVIEYTTDQEVMAETRGYCVRFAKVAARFRKELMEQYGSERGSKIRYTEAYEVREYGAPLTGAVKEMLECAATFCCTY